MPSKKTKTIPTTDAERIEQHEKQSYAWMKVAEKEGYKCEVCGNTIILEDKDIYYLYDKCGHCYHIFSKED